MTLLIPVVFLAILLKRKIFRKNFPIEVVSKRCNFFKAKMNIPDFEPGDREPPQAG
jgi:hypothetical protein